MIKVFKYIEELNCFVVDPEYKEIVNELGLTEWNEVVWIGRFFMLDNDYGEHWFDNWDLREGLEVKAQEAGYASDDLMILDPDRFINGKDGPCHDAPQRLLFWTDVLKSLQLSLDTLVAEATRVNEKRKADGDDEYIPDLEFRIRLIKEEQGQS